MLRTIILLLSTIACLAQSDTPAPLRVFVKDGITSDTIIDNRNQTNRQLTYISIACSGSGSWSASLQYSSSASGPWTSYGSSATVTSADSVPIASGFKTPSPSFFKVDVTGTVSCSLSGFKYLYVNGGSGSISFPLGIGSGGTGATTAAGARTNLGLNLTGVYTGDGTTPSGVAADIPLKYLRRSKITSSVAYEFAKAPLYNAEDYDFAAITPGTNITGGAYNQITIPCPMGIGGVTSGSPNLNFDYPLTITNVTNNGTGGIRVTVSTPVNVADGSRFTITGVGGVTAANGEFLTTTISTTQFDLTGAVFSGTYTSGGAMYRNIHQLYISGGTGTEELVFISGGTCTSGAASGTLRFYAANNHTGAWNIRSATAGGMEAAFADSNTFKRIVYPSGTSTIQGIFLLPSQLGLDISGNGMENTVLVRGLNKSAPMFAVRALSSSVNTIHDLWINDSNQTLTSGAVAIDLQNITCCGFVAKNIKIWDDAIGVKVNSSDDIVLDNIRYQQTSRLFQPLHGLFVTEASSNIGGASSNVFINSGEYATSEGLTAGIYTVSGAANNGSGRIRITTSSANAFVTGDIVTVASVLGTTEANGAWTVTVINSTTFDLQGSTFTNAYISGGTAMFTNVLQNGALIESGDGLVFSGGTYLRGEFGLRVNPGVVISGVIVDGAIIDRVRYSSLAIGATTKVAMGQISIHDSWLVGNYFPSYPGVAIDMTNITEGRYTIHDNDIAGHKGACMSLTNTKGINIHDNSIVSCDLSGTSHAGIELTGSTAQSNVSGAANDGTGAIRITTASATGFVTGDTVVISGITGTTEANGTWVITVLTSTTFKLNGSTFTNAYVSGGIAYCPQKRTSAFTAHDNRFFDVGSIGASTNWAFYLNSDIANSQIHHNNIDNMQNSPFFYQAGTNTNFIIWDNVVTIGNPSVSISGSAIAIPNIIPAKLGIAGGGTANRMTGGWPGMKIKVIFTGATTISTGGTNPGNFARALSVSPFQMIEFEMLADGIWYSTN